MSHFTVLVVTHGVDDDQVEKALQPYHEYECTGIDDQFVVDVDRTDEVAAWLGRTLYVGLNKETGKEDYYYDEDTAVKLLASHTVLSTARHIELTSKDPDEVVRDYFGYTLKDDKWISRTNPNAKWDCWTIGGRWSGLLITSKGEEVNQCRIGDLDLKKMELARKVERQKCWDAYVEDRDEKSVPVAVLGFLYGIKEGTEERDYVDTDTGFSTFAVVKNGIWYERGSMGWFGVVADEKPEDTWDREYTELVGNLPDDTWITVVDCHI